MTQRSAHAPPIAVAVGSLGSTPVVSIAGELDIATALSIREPLLTATENPLSGLVIDLSDLTFCGSAGLAELLTARQRCVEHGTSVTLVGCRPSVRRVLSLVGVDRLFTLADTVAEATFATV
jgi:anti-anti-sigma factor